MALELNDVSAGFNLTRIQENFQLIEDFLNNDVLKREIADGEDNAMRTHLDMNGNVIVNTSRVISADELEAALAILGETVYETQT
jgi:repressor of nif and glnA expression